MADGKPDEEEIERLLYDHLRAVASRIHQRQGNPGSVRPSSLVQEAWLRLSATRNEADRMRILAISSRIMRQILTDRARRRLSAKRGGGQERIALDNLGTGADALDLVSVDQVLTELEALDPRGARVVELRCFGGLELEEIAELTGVSAKTVARDWRACRAWLRVRLQEIPPEPGTP